MDSESSLSISNRVATADCWVLGEKGSATKAKVVAELQEKSGSSWSTIATWTDTQNAYKASVYSSKTVTVGKTYRVKATVTVWKGSLSETQLSLIHIYALQSAMPRRKIKIRTSLLLCGIIIAAGFFMNLFRRSFLWNN